MILVAGEPPSRCWRDSASIASKWIRITSGIKKTTRFAGLLQSIHTLTGHVIVEGIETEKQKRLITSAGDIIGQGRYWKEEYIFLCG